MAKPVKVIGIGPGSPDYLLPVALSAVRDCQVVIGSPRALKLFDLTGKRSHSLDGDLASIIPLLKNRAHEETVGVLVSGDPGFYSFLTYLRRHLQPEEIEVIPGISSVQVAFARLGIPWQKAGLLSLHGRTVDNFPSYLTKGEPLGLLVDSRATGQELKKMIEPYGSFKIHICRNLTYPDEEIVTVTVRELPQVGDFGNAVVVIEPDDQG